MSRGLSLKALFFFVKSIISLSFLFQEFITTDSQKFPNDIKLLVLVSYPKTRSANQMRHYIFFKWVLF
jgi:hypothetical protein